MSANLLASLSPLLLVIALTAWLKCPAFVAAWCGTAWVLALMLALPVLQPSPGALAQGSAAAGLITLQAALVIGPGLYLNALLQRAGTHALLVDWVGRLPMRPVHKRLMVIVGLAPALESLTGFGVSLLVTVPLLLAISERGPALRQSLLSMNIMPWGTLGLATLVGAQLGHQPVASLGAGTSLVSFGVFPAFAAWGAWQSAAPGERWPAWRDGVAAGSCLSIALVAFNRLGWTESAGVLAGICVAGLCFLVLRTGPATDRLPWRATRPYAVLLASMAVLRLAPHAGLPLGHWALTAGAVRFAPLTSPGLALLLTILFIARGRIAPGPLADAARRGLRPLLALGGFTLMAQCMVAGDMVRLIGQALPAGRPGLLAAASPLLGLLSGYLTGSNVGGNALMMTMQTGLARDGAMAAVLAAAQNSGAGHAVFASMPIVVLVMAIAGTNTSQPREEADLLRFGLKTLCGVAAISVAATLLLMHAWGAG